MAFRKVIKFKDSIRALADSNTIGSIFTTGGNIGIGTTAPSSKLDVNGDINLTGTLYQNSAPFSTSQWTGSVGSAISYTSGTVIMTNGSINNLTISNLTANAATLGNVIMTGGNININTDTTSTNFISFEKLTTSSGATEPNIALSSTSDGGYVVSSSTSVLEPAWTDWRAFNKYADDGWHSNGPLYNVDYLGSVSTTFANGTVYLGEWIQLQLPTSEVFTSVKLTPRPNFNGTAPRDFVVVGSTSGNNESWVSLYSTTGVTFGNGGASDAQTFTFPPIMDSYNYVRLIINKIGSIDAVQLMEIEYYTTDTTVLYPNTFLGKRIYSGTRASELLLFKGNDSATTEIDRIRLLSAEHRFDTASVQGIFDQIATSGTTRMIVTSSGNVGIGTTAPSFTLTVNGTIGAVAVTTGALAATNISVTNLVATNETVVNLVTTNETVQNLIIVDDLLVTDLSSSNSTITNSLITNLSATNLAFTSVSAGSATATIGTVVATNLSATNETVSSLLATNVSASNITVTNILITDATVTGTILILGNSLKAVSNSNTVGTIFTTGGNVGIGTVSPSYKLQVNGGLYSTNITTTKLVINTGSVTNESLLLTNVSNSGVISFGDEHHSIRSGHIDKMELREYGSIGFWTGGFLQNQTLRIFLPSTGNIGISTTSPNFTLDVNGTFEANNTSGVLCFASTGNVGIGTTSPSYRLDVDGDISLRGTQSAPDFIYANGGGDNSCLNIRAGSSPGIWSQIQVQGHWNGSSNNGGNVSFYTTGAERMRITDAGNVGIGTTTPSQRLEVVSTLGINTNNSTGALRFTSSGDINYIQSGQNFTSDSRRPLRFTSMFAGSTFMTLDTSGNLGIGITSPSYRLHVSGDIYATGDVISFSDKRLKENIENISEPLSKIKNLQGVYYTNTQTKQKGVGLIAQEVEKIIPEAVADRGEYLGVAYGNLVGVLIEAVKELSEKVNILETRLSSL